VPVVASATKSAVKGVFTESPPTVVSEIPPVALSVEVSASATPSTRLRAPEPNATAPRLVIMFDGEFSVTLAPCVLNANVSAVIPTATDWVIVAPPVLIDTTPDPAFKAPFKTSAPAVLSVTPPLAVAALESVSALPSTRLKAPDPSPTTPRLVMLLDAEFKETFPLCVLNDKLPAVIPTPEDSTIAEPAPVVVRNTEPVPALRPPFTDRVPPMFRDTPPLAVSAPAMVNAVLVVRLNAPVPSDTAPRLATALSAVPNATLPSTVLNDSVPAVITDVDWLIEAVWLIPAPATVVASATEPLVVSAPARLNATLSDNANPPEPSDTTPRLVMLLDATLNAIAPLTVLNDSVPAVIAAEAVWLIPAPAVVVARLTDPVAVNAPVRLSATLSDNTNPPEPSETTPRLVMLLDAEPKVTFAPSVLSATVPAVIPRSGEDDCVIVELCPVVVRVTPPAAVT